MAARLCAKPIVTHVPLTLPLPFHRPMFFRALGAHGINTRIPVEHIASTNPIDGFSVGQLALAGSALHALPIIAVYFLNINYR